MPGVQNPHCSPCSCVKPCCNACSTPACSKPSIVSTSASWHCTVSTVHDLTDMPSRSTVHAPQCVVSQPICGPVCSSFSRNVWISNSRGSTTTSTALPLSLNDTACFLAICVLDVESVAG